MQNDYSLLRPFNLEAAKKGEKIVCGGKTSSKFYQLEEDLFCIKWDTGPRGVYELPAVKNSFKMAPLFWLEGKPVYKGDPLFFNGVTVSGGVYVSSIDKDFDAHVTFIERKYSIWAPIVTLTWNKPKEEKVGYVAVLKSSYGTIYAESYIFSTEQEALTCGLPNIISVNKITYTV